MEAFVQCLKSGTKVPKVNYLRSHYLKVITFLRTLKVVSARRYIKLGGKLIDLM